MKVIAYALVGAAALALGACTQKPEKSIEKDCVRLGMMKELSGADEAGQKKTCACFAGKLKSDMSEANLKSLAKSLKASKTEDEFEAESKKNGLDEADSMVMMGAAKACATGS